MFRNVSRHGKTLSLGQFRRGVQAFRFFFAVCFHGGTEPLVDLFPAGDKHGLSLGGELISCTGKYRSHGFVLMGRGYRAEQFGADKVHQLAFTLGKAGEALFYKFGCGKDGVVVRYLFAVQNPAHFRGQVKSLGKGQQPQQVRHKMLCCLAHILGQILAVGAGIGQQFLLVKLLGIVKGLLCREAEQAVCLPLQGGQVIELGRLFRLFLSPNGRADCICTCAFFFERICGFCIRNAPTVCFQAAGLDADRVILFFLEAQDFCIPVHQHFQCRGLHPAYRQGFVIQHRKQPCCIDAHQPIRLCTAEGRLIQSIIIRIRAQVCKALPDSGILHAGNPEPLHRFCAAGHLVDETENQFSLPACVGRGGHTVHIRAVEQRAHNFKLLFLFVRDNELPRLGQNGQILIPPLTVFFIVLARLCKGHQMPDAPADQIPAALPIAVLLFSGPDHGGNAAGHTGFFGDHQLKAHVSSSCPFSE